MENKVFGEVVFDAGWETKSEITLWGRTYPILVCASAYYETDGITEAQEESYTEYKKTISEKQKRIEALSAKYYKDFPLEKRFVDEDFDLENFDPEKLWEELTPRFLVIERDGKCALLFDQKSDPDDGLAVVISPEEEVLTQDGYL